MTILLTGSAGKTAAALAESLTPENKILVASRRPSPNGKHPTVRFDWLDDNTWPNVFSHAEAKASPISAVYLVLPDLPEARKNAIPFVRLCMSHGARRFVLLSAWENAEGGALLGGVHAELKAMENFTEPYHLDTIKSQRKIYSGAGEGQKPFIAARDIAAVAHRALLDLKPLNTDQILTGPESLTYTDIANTLSDVLGTKVEHVSLEPDAFREKLSDFGLTAEMSEYMTDLDVRVAQGVGKEVSPAVEKVTGSRALTFREFAERIKHVWQ